MFGSLTICISVDFPIHTDTISTLCTLMGHIYNFLNNDAFLSLKVVLMLANSTDPENIAFGCISSGSSLFAKVPA